jgi:hypothetical protein
VSSATDGVEQGRHALRRGFPQVVAMSLPVCTAIGDGSPPR